VAAPSSVADDGSPQWGDERPLGFADAWRRAQRAPARGACPPGRLFM